MLILNIGKINKNEKFDNVYKNIKNLYAEEYTCKINFPFMLPIYTKQRA